MEIKPLHAETIIEKDRFLSFRIDNQSMKKTVQQRENILSHFFI